MQLLATLAGAGKLGGVVGTHGRAGAQLRARTARTQPRSVSQTHARALTGSVAALWRDLAPSDQAGWAALAENPQTGYSTFAACARNLLTIGLLPVPTPPGQRPTFPPILSFEVTPEYTSPALPRVLSTWLIDTVPTIPASFATVLRVTQCLSQAKANIRASDYRVAQTRSAAFENDSYTAAAWESLWGQGPSTGNVTFKLNLVDPLTGFASPAVNAFSFYTVTGPTPPPGGTVTLEQEEVPIAVTTGIVYEQDGTAIAGE